MTMAEFLRFAAGCASLAVLLIAFAILVVRSKP